jgi:hypothetical protein
LVGLCGTLVDQVEGATAGAHKGLELVDHGDEAPVVTPQGLLFGVVEGASGADPLVEGPRGGVQGAEVAQTAVEVGGAIGEKADAIYGHGFFVLRMAAGAVPLADASGMRREGYGGFSARMVAYGEHCAIGRKV